MDRKGQGVLRRLAATAAGLAVSWAAGVQAAQVEVRVTGVTDTRGHVRVELCTRKTFLTEDCPYGGAAPATVGETLVQLEAPPGEYAVQAFHDETDSGRIHQNLLGIPHERIGFSNDAPLGLRGPSFDTAAVFIGAQARRITLRLRHLLGN
jgi:uncharacterized protein (DUF2141 family)